MTPTPRILILLDLGDGEPPIQCNSAQEAEFLADVWLAYCGDIGAAKRASKQVDPMAANARRLVPRPTVRP